MSMVNNKNSKLLFKFLLLALAVLISPPWLLMCFLVFALLGLMDVSRNTPLNVDTLKRYFTGNGILTWVMSPFNLFIDLISLKNKGVYQLQDLPKEHQKEISELLTDVQLNKEFLIKEMSTKLSAFERGMLFFKWYGDNIETFISLPCFHKKYKLIKTIGISAFNSQKATSVHYGPLRITLRVLYNLSPEIEGDVYIQVNGKKYYWKDNPLFIFDDTLQHQSVNYSDQIRHCMFIDIIRPTYVGGVLSALLTCMKLMVSRINNVFYKKWVFLK